VDIRISDFLLSSASGSTAQYDMRITQYGSIKIERLCKTNPIFKKPKMNLNHYTTNDYKNNSSPLTMENQTQSKPNKLEANLAEIPTGELLGILKPGTKQTLSCPP